MELQEKNAKIDQARSANQEQALDATNIKNSSPNFGLGHNTSAQLSY